VIKKKVGKNVKRKKKKIYNKFKQISHLNKIITKASYWCKHKRIAKANKIKLFKRLKKRQLLLKILVIKRKRKYKSRNKQIKLLPTPIWQYNKQISKHFLISLLEQKGSWPITRVILKKNVSHAKSYKRRFFNLTKRKKAHPSSMLFWHRIMNLSSRSTKSLEVPYYVYKYIPDVAILKDIRKRKKKKYYYLSRKLRSKFRYSQVLRSEYFRKKRNKHVIELC